MANSIPLGPTTVRTGANIERIRKERGISQADLSKRLAELGRPTLASVVSKMELAQRRIDADDIVAVALALNVSPLTLLMPATATLDQVALTDAFHISEQSAWSWASGEAPASDFLLDAPGAHTEAEHKDYWSAREQYLRVSRPAVRFAPGETLARAFATLRAEIERLFVHADDADRDATEQDVDAQVARIDNWINLIHAEVDQVVAAFRRRRAYRRAMPTRSPDSALGQGIPLEEFRNDPAGHYPRTAALSDLGVEDPE